MPTALDVARYVINFAYDHNMSMSNTRLQLTLYFIRLNTIQKLNDPCFIDNFEAWVLGPVIPSIYHRYRRYMNFNIPKIYNIYDTTDGLFNVKKMPYKSNIEPKYIPVIDDAIKTCCEYPTPQLLEIAKKQSPWKSHYKPSRQNIIPIKSFEIFIKEELWS